MAPILAQKLLVDSLVPTRKAKLFLQDIYYFKVRTYNKCFAFAPGAPSGSHWGNSQRSPDLLVGLGGHFLAEKAREDTKKGERMKGGYGKLGLYNLSPSVVDWLRGYAHCLWSYNVFADNTLSLRHFVTLTFDLVNFYIFCHVIKSVPMLNVLQCEL